MAEMHRLGWTVLGLVVVAALALGSDSPDKTSAAGPGEARACSKQETKRALRHFVHAFNRGNSEALDQLFDEEPGFQWYSTGPPGARSGNGASRRSSLIQYFSNRHRRHDRLHLRGFGTIFKDWGGPEYDRGSHFSLTLSRRADGFNRGRWFRMGRTSSKGAMICEGRQPRIIVLSLGGPPWMARR
jgi:hypothetical protein